MNRPQLTDLTPHRGDRAVGIMLWIVGIGLILWALSDHANAIEHNARSQQAGYVKALEDILAKCLSRADSPIWVDGEMWLCSATPTGIKMGGGK